MPTAGNDFFQKKHNTPVACLVGLLLFFLPFVQIRCNNVPFAENTGMGLAFGTDYKVTAQAGTLGEGLGTINRSAKTSEEKGKMYVLALIALVLGLTGLMVSLSDYRGRFMIGMVAGWAAAVSLIIVMIQIKADVKATVKEPDTADQLGTIMRVTVAYTFWFYLSIISFLAAGFFAYKHRQISAGRAALSPPASSSLTSGAIAEPAGLDDKVS